MDISEIRDNIESEIVSIEKRLRVLRKNIDIVEEQRRGIQTITENLQGDVMRLYNKLDDLA